MATVSAETRGAVGLAPLSRPDARNVLSPEEMEELAELLVHGR
jgi:enoyl-CoA hydratase/carnithine racemase